MIIMTAISILEYFVILSRSDKTTFYYQSEFRGNRAHDILEGFNFEIPHLNVLILSE